MKEIFKYLVGVGILFGFIACGVKGPPLPPLPKTPQSSDREVRPSESPTPQPTSQERD